MRGKSKRLSIFITLLILLLIALLTFGVKICFFSIVVAEGASKYRKLEHVYADISVVASRWSSLAINLEKYSNSLERDNETLFSFSLVYLPSAILSFGYVQLYNKYQKIYTCNQASVMKN